MSLSLEAILTQAEDAVVFDYILTGKIMKTIIMKQNVIFQ